MSMCIIVVNDFFSVEQQIETIFLYTILVVTESGEYNKFETSMSFVYYLEYPSGRDKNII